MWGEDFLKYMYVWATSWITWLLPSDSSDYEDVEVFPYFDSVGDDFNRPSQVGAENEDDGDADGLG